MCRETTLVESLRFCDCRFRLPVSCRTHARKPAVFIFFPVSETGNRIETGCPAWRSRLHFSIPGLTFSNKKIILGYWKIEAGYPVSAAFSFFCISNIYFENSAV
jgi:hypothetical protein